MYWSIHRYPSLAHRSRKERAAIVQSAVREHGGWYRKRLLVAFAFVAVGTMSIHRVIRGASLLEWRAWVAPVVMGALLYGYLLWEINGAIHTAVKKYLAGRNL